LINNLLLGVSIKDNLSKKIENILNATTLVVSLFTNFILIE